MVERFRLNEPAIAAEEIDSEVVAINFDNGHYHALRGTGAAVFGALVRGYSLSEITKALLVRHEVEGGLLRGSLRTFLDALCRHALLVADPDARSPVGPPFEPVAAARPAFDPPVLETFDDMEHFLLLDPVHDVDETGWPRVPVHPEGPHRPEGDE